MKITKQYITKNLLNKNGGLNSRRTAKIIATVEELYLIYNNLSSSPKCECGGELNFHNFVYGYSSFCGTKCSNNSEVTKEKKIQSYIKNYGVENPNQSEKIKEKKKETCRKRYGVDHYSKTEEYKKKYNQTCKERYDVENTFQVKEFKIKIKETMLEIYGVENPTQSAEIRQKKKENFKEMHGVEHNSQLEEVKRAKALKCMNTFGVDNNFKSDYIKRKSKITKMKKYGNENYTNRKKAKETCIVRYGTEYPMQSGLCSSSGYNFKDYIYPSGKIVQIQGYEDQLLDILIEDCDEDDILTDRKDMPEFWYFTNDGKKHRYFPDAYIPKDNAIYEVKSTWTLEQSEKNGIFDLKYRSVIDKGYEFTLAVF